MIAEAIVWLTLFAPLASFVLIGFIVWPSAYLRSKSDEATPEVTRGVTADDDGHTEAEQGETHHTPQRDGLGDSAGIITIGAVGIAFVVSLAALFSTISNHGHIEFPDHRWLTVGEFEFNVGILMDPLTAVMLVVVTGVSLMIQIYSVGYMSEEDNRAYSRYFAYMSLFTASMVGLVLASSVIQVFVFWELVGLCSYLLIGFWYNRSSAANAAKKAFIVTRVGDFGFLLAILYLFFNQNALAAEGLNGLDIADLYKAVEVGLIAGGVATWIAAGIFAGAVGKSGQFPLHTWLPDAMEGPTPVSALIHAATMVAAGVFLVARFFPLFQASHEMMTAVAIVGAFTAIFAASIGTGDERHKARARVLNGQPAWVHDDGAGHGRVRVRHLSPVHPRLLQGAAVSRIRLGQPRVGDFQHEIHGRPEEGHALDVLHLPDRQPRSGRDIPDRRVLEQGRDTGPRLPRGIDGGHDRVRARTRGGVHDGVLYVPRAVYDLRRRFQGRGRGRVWRRGRRLRTPPGPREPARVAASHGRADGNSGRTGRGSRLRREPAHQPREWCRFTGSQTSWERARWRSTCRSST